MKVFFAYMFIIAGGILVMYGATMKTTSGFSETLNIGLLFNQFNLTLSALYYLLVGILFRQHVNCRKSNF